MIYVWDMWVGDGWMTGECMCVWEGVYGWGVCWWSMWDGEGWVTDARVGGNMSHKTVKCIVYVYNIHLTMLFFCFFSFFVLFV